MTSRAARLTGLAALIVILEACHTQAGGVRRPYTPTGEPWKIPGRIEAEDFDEGGTADPAYWDSTRGNQASADQHYRDSDVDVGMEPLLNIVDVGWIDRGEWLEYTVRVEQTGFYTVSTRIATPLDNKRFHLEFDRINRTGLITVPNTGCWGSDLKGGNCFQDLVTRHVKLVQGVSRLRFVADTGHYTVDRFDFTKESP